MKHLLEIGHWAPICPDIIPSIPFQEGDNLVIDSIPGDFESQRKFKASSGCFITITSTTSISNLNYPKPRLFYKIRIVDVIWTVGDEFSEERHEIEGHKVLLIVVPNFSTTSEFAILSTDTNGKSNVTGVSLEIKL